MGLNTFEGAVAVITGGASGIGAAMARRFGHEGARLVLADVEVGALDAEVAFLTDKGFDAVGVVTDVRSRESVTALADHAYRTFGKVNILCNNAGVGSGSEGRIWEYETNDWAWATGVNVWGVINGISVFVPRMLEQGHGGVVINTSSGNGGVAPLASTPIYAMTKAAVTCITECLHAHLREVQAPLSAAVLYPGPHMLRTGLWTSWRNRPGDVAKVTPRSTPYPTLDQMEEAMRAAGMDVRFTEPDEVADQVVEAIRADRFWILPPSEETDRRVRARAEAMLARSAPDYLYPLPTVGGTQVPSSGGTPPAEER